MFETTMTLSAEDYWNRAVLHFRKLLTSEEEISKMERYFPMFQSKELKGDEFIISVPQAIHVEWFTPLFTKPLEESLHAVGLPSSVQVRFVVRELRS